MEIQSDAEVMGDTKCVVCFEKYNKTTRAPISASCGHTFCKRCFIKGTIFKSFSCHLCRGVTFFGSSELSKNYTILNLLESMGALDNDDNVDDPMTVQDPMDPFAQDGFIINATQEAMKYAQHYLTLIINYFAESESDHINDGCQLFVRTFNHVESLRKYHDFNMGVDGRYLTARIIPMDEAFQTPLYLPDGTRNLLAEHVEDRERVEQMLICQHWPIVFRFSDDVDESFTSNDDEFRMSDEEVDNIGEEGADEVVQNNGQPEAQINPPTPSWDAIEVLDNIDSETVARMESQIQAIDETFRDIRHTLPNPYHPDPRFVRMSDLSFLAPPVSAQVLVVQAPAGMPQTQAQMNATDAPMGSGCIPFTDFQ